MAASTLLEEALEAWKYAREGVIAEVENIPATEFGFRPAPESRTLTELVQHIVQFGLLMSGELPRADGDFQRLTFAEFEDVYMRAVDEKKSKEALLTVLQVTLEDGIRALATAGEVQMLQRIRQFDGTYATRLSWLNHGIAHEEYHRGQVALYSRILGHVPALTRSFQE
jgi:uncharacterized damage-inducible protein DinB